MRVGCVFTGFRHYRHPQSLNRAHCRPRMRHGEIPDRSVLVPIAPRVDAFVCGTAGDIKGVNHTLPYGQPCLALMDVDRLGKFCHATVLRFDSMFELVWFSSLLKNLASPYFR